MGLGTGEGGGNGGGVPLKALRRRAEITQHTASGTRSQRLQLLCNCPSGPPQVTDSQIVTYGKSRLAYTQTRT